MLTARYLEELCGRFLRVEDAISRKEVFELVSVSCLAPLPQEFTDKYLAKQPKQRKKLETLRASPQSSQNTMNSLVEEFTNIYIEGEKSEIISQGLNLISVLLQSATTRKFVPGLLEFHKFPIAEISDLHMLLVQESGQPLRRFRRKFPITAQKFSIFQIFQEISDPECAVVAKFAVTQPPVQIGESGKSKFVEIFCTNFRFSVGEWLLLGGLGVRVVEHREDSLRVQVFVEQQISDPKEISVLSLASQAALARVAIADEILASRNFRLSQEISDPLLGLASNEDNKISLGRMEISEIGNFLDSLPDRVLFVSRKFPEISDHEEFLLLGQNEHSLVQKFLNRRLDLLAQAKNFAIVNGRSEISSEISHSCQIAVHALNTEFSDAQEISDQIGNFRWLELVKEPSRRVDALLAKFARIVCIEADKFPFFFARLKELNANFGCVVFEAADTEIDVVLAASLSGVTRVVLLNGGATYERMTKLGTSENTI